LTVPSTQTVGLDPRYDSLHENGGGVYYDGTYTALADASQEEGETLPDAQEFYYDSLLKQFRLVQATMRCTPPLAAIECLAPSKLISFPADSRKARNQWQALVKTLDPHPAQIAVMDPESVLELIKLLRVKLIPLLNSRDKSTVSRVGAWLWAVLGKCRDRGELSSEEVSELRLLAQRAIYIQNRDAIDPNQQPSNGHTDSVDDESDDGDSQNEDSQSQRMSAMDEGGVGSAGEDGKAGVGEGGFQKATDRGRLIAVALDMVITVVGEVYGQRDLLESRRKWEGSKVPR